MINENDLETQDLGDEDGITVEIPMEEVKTKNLVSKISEDRLKTIADQVFDGYEVDLASRSNLMNRIEKWLRLWYVKPEYERKSDPFPDASNIVVPMMNIACSQFYARASDALLSQKDIVKAIITKDIPGAQEAADRVSKYMDWQIKYKMPNYMEGMRKSLMQLPLIGTVIRKAFYDSVNKTVNVDFISSNDFVINSNARYLSSAPRISHIIDVSINDLRIKEADGIYENVDQILNPSTQLDPTDLGIVIEEVSGVEKDQENEFGFRKVIEQHVYLAIFDEKGKEIAQEDIGKAISLPYIVHMDMESKTILGIEESKNEKTTRLKEFFVKYEFLPSPDSSFDSVGFGLLLERINETSNTIVNQLIDAGTLANTQSGFVAKGTGMARGQVSFDRGRFVEIALPRNTDDVRKVITPMTFKEPSQVLLTLLGTLEGYANRVTTVSEMFTGEMPSSDTSATAVVKLLEQGLKVFASIYKALHESFQKELQLIYNLNAEYLEDDEYTDINSAYTSMAQGEQPSGTTQKITRADFQHQLAIIPVSDPGVISRTEKIQKAQMEYEMGMKNPMIMNNPQAVFILTKNLFDVMEEDKEFTNALFAPIMQQLQMQIQQQQLMEQEMQQRKQALAMYQEHMNQGNIPPEVLQGAMQDQMAAQQPQQQQPQGQPQQ